MARHKDTEWTLAEEGLTGGLTWEQVGIAVLMDIRDELKRLNAAIYCQNALAIPALLRNIDRNTKPKRKRAKRQVTPRHQRRGT